MSKNPVPLNGSEGRVPLETPGGYLPPASPRLQTRPTLLLASPSCHPQSQQLHQPDLSFCRHHVSVLRSPASLSPPSGRRDYSKARFITQALF